MEVMQRIPAIAARMGKCRTVLYEDAKRGLLTKLVKLGPRSVGLPASEVTALLNARIAGATDQQLKDLVQRLMAERASKMPKL